MTPDSAANARLCAWLGIAPKEWQLRCRRDGWQCGRPSFDTQQQADEYREKNGHSDYDAVPIYPALDTREGFLDLRDALKAKGFIVQVSSESGKGLMPPFALAIIFREIEKLAKKSATTEEAALFAAAVALMEREAGK